MTVIAVIELDDTSHNSTKGKAKDKFINDISETTQLPLIRFKAKISYDSKLIKEEIYNKLLMSVT